MGQRVGTLSEYLQEEAASQVLAQPEIGIGNPEQFAGSLLIRQPMLIYFIAKRILDVVLAFVGIIVLIPVFLTIAVCIKLDDGGSILHLREIIGYKGQRFFALKFRTMISDADACSVG